MERRRLFIPHTPNILFRNDQLTINNVKDLLIILKNDIIIEEKICGESELEQLEKQLDNQLEKQLEQIKNFLNDRYSLDSIEYDKETYNKNKTIRYLWIEKFIDEGGNQRFFQCKQIIKHVFSKDQEVILFNEIMNPKIKNMKDDDYQYFFEHKFGRSICSNSNNEILWFANAAVSTDKEIYKAVFELIQDLLLSADSEKTNPQYNLENKKQYNKILSAIETDNPFINFEDIRKEFELDIIDIEEYTNDKYHKENSSILEIGKNWISQQTTNLFK